MARVFNPREDHPLVQEERINKLAMGIEMQRGHIRSIESELAHYQKIGEPSELRKVTFCPDCKKQKTCHIFKNFGSDDFFCKIGEPREERENEL